MTVQGELKKPTRWIAYRDRAWLTALPRRAPNLRTADPFLFGLCSQFLSPRRLLRTAIILQPAMHPSEHLSWREEKCSGNEPSCVSLKAALLDF